MIIVKSQPNYLITLKVRKGGRAVEKTVVSARGDTPSQAILKAIEHKTNKHQEVLSVTNIRYDTHFPALITLDIRNE